MKRYRFDAETADVGEIFRNHAARTGWINIVKVNHIGDPLCSVEIECADEVTTEQIAKRFGLAASDHIGLVGETG